MVATCDPVGIKYVGLLLVCILGNHRSAEGSTIYCCWINFYWDAGRHVVWIDHGEHATRLGCLEHLLEVDSRI